MKLFLLPDAVCRINGIRCVSGLCLSPIVPSIWAHIDGTIGERHNPETHLIPLILQTASGRRNNFKIYGDDYKTKDGTCVRDYIHVMDIAEAHLLSSEKLIVLNLSNAALKPHHSSLLANGAPKQ